MTVHEGKQASVTVGPQIKQISLLWLFCCSLQNLHAAVDPIVSKPKPKVEPPKDEQPSTKMEDDSKPSQNATKPPPASEDMDLD